MLTILSDLAVVIIDASSSSTVQVSMDGRTEACRSTPLHLLGEGIMGVLTVLMKEEAVRRKKKAENSFYVIDGTSEQYRI